MLEGNYEAQLVEKKWQEYWDKKKIYSFDPESKKTIYSIDTPPPYASADHLHVGHAMHYSQFEFVARYKKMRGFNVFFPMGYDDNGLPTERFVEKKHNVNKSTITRANFIKLCLEETKRCGQVYHDLFNNLGFSLDWSLLYHTIDYRSRFVSQAGFIELYKKGSLEHNDLPTTWCMNCQTTIAQADFDNIELLSQFHDIAFKCGPKDLIIATTRPELIPACVALFANPQDERYNGLKGKSARVPLFNYEVPILFDETVDKEKGTGLMMCCTFGDKEDVEKWYKHKLPLRIVFTENGRMNDAVPVYSGLKIKDARAKIIEDLKREGFLIRQQSITHAVNVHERCGTEVEFLKKKQWSIRVLDKKDELMAIADKINWHPKHMKVRYEHWVKNLQWDWGINRQRYYGVPFPVWYCAKCGEIRLAKIEELPVDPREEQPKAPCGCGSTSFTPEMDVMDTWMTSSMTPYINARWKMKDERKDFVPMSLRPQAHDIIRTWTFYTIVKAYYLEGKIPWQNIMISGHGQDQHGKKMSKSKGNFIIANDVIKKFSADALRFWAASSKLGEDLPYQEKDLVTGKKTITKLWNAAKLCYQHLEDYNPAKAMRFEELEITDRWLLLKLNETVKSATDYFEDYNFSEAKKATEQFFWHDFCDNYLEIVKHRLYDKENKQKERLSAQHTLHYVFLGILKLFAPIMPYITEELYQDHYPGKDKHAAKSIHLSDWPGFNDKLKDDFALEAGELAISIISEVRKHKAAKSISMKQEIESVVAETIIDLEKLPSDDLRNLKQDIISTINSKVLEIRKGPGLKVIIS